LQVELTIVLNDVIIFFIALLYAVLVLVIGDLGRRRLKLGSDFTRKIIHLFAGGAIWTVPFYTHAWVAVLVAVTFVVMLGLSTQERFGRFFSAMARPEDLEYGSVRGPFWYAVSITLLTAIFTFAPYEEYYFLAAAGIHIMMLGDGMSAPIGIKYGKNHTITIFGSKRSLQGCAALFFFGLIGAMVAILFFGVYNYGTLAPGGQILWSYVLTLALSGAAGATLIELVSPKGTDNVTVPFGSTVVMYLVAVYLGLVAF
jgi:phytol kinase